VGKINDSTATKKLPNTVSLSTIGLLDIFGFESFQVRKSVVVAIGVPHDCMVYVGVVVAKLSLYVNTIITTYYYY